MSRRHSHYHHLHHHAQDDIEVSNSTTRQDSHHPHPHHHRVYYDYDSQSPRSSPSFSSPQAQAHSQAQAQSLHHRVHLHSSDNNSNNNNGSALLETPNGSHDHPVHDHHHHRLAGTAAPTTAHLHPTQQAPVPVDYCGRQQHNGHAIMPLPGRAMRRKRLANRVKHRRHNNSIFCSCQRLYAHWFPSTSSSSSSSNDTATTGTDNNTGSLLLAVALWYTLGVVSIGTSKILLGHHELGISIVGNVPPIFLTLQQLFIGSSLLRVLIENPLFLGGGFLGTSSSSSSLSSRGVVQPWPKRPVVVEGTGSFDFDQQQQRRQSLLQTAEAAEEKAARAAQQRGGGSESSSSKTATNLLWLYSFFRELHPSLLWAAVYFGLGFLLTNIGFSGSPASFVETIKASEPITSASVAVGYGIEVLSKQEVASLLAIVAGVVLSTVGNNQHATTTATGTATVTSAPSPIATSSSLLSSSSSLYACTIVMISNLCFSFRGLHQKLFRATPQGSMERVDDLNLQFRMQQLGVRMLIGPVLLLEGRTLLSSILWHLTTTRLNNARHYLNPPLAPVDATVGGVDAAEAGGGRMYSSPSLSGTIVCYVALAVINGCAFTGYNLSSTYLLSRISVVHHAALNCLRRIFAIIVTSLLFRVPFTRTGFLGIACSFVGFIAFSHYKVQRQQQQQRAVEKEKQQQQLQESSSSSPPEHYPLLLPSTSSNHKGGEHES